MIRGIIVEDEISLRKLIRKFVKEIDAEIEFVAECENIDEAEVAIAKYKPEIIFLDVIMPRGTGLDLLERLPNIKSEIIFVTAYDKYVLDAFKFAATGYVLKPIDKNELKIAINNAKKRIVSKLGNNLDQLLDYIQEHDHKTKIGIPTQEGVIFANIKDIIHCEGYNSYTRIFLNDGTCIVSSYNLSRFEKILPKDTFFKVHKSHILSLEYVKRYNASDAVVEMEVGKSVPISRKAKTEFLKFFKMPRR